MKKFVFALATLSALVATPAMAGSNFHVGFYSPAPVYYAPPVAYYPPVNHVYYAPREVRYEPPCPRQYGYGYGVGRGHGYTRGHDYVRHDRGYRRDYARANYSVNNRNDWHR